MTDRKWLCAYAITRNRLPELGLEPPPRLVGHLDLGLVVADVDPARFESIDTEDPADRALVDLARRHDAVVRAVFRHEPVLPLRFGTVFAGEDAAVRLLRSSYRQACAYLEQVAGHREWGVRTRLAEVAAEPASVGGLTGTEYLLRRRERLASARRAKQSADVSAKLLHDRLRAYATRDVERARASGVLADTAYLVAAERESLFHKEIDRLASELCGSGVAVETTGPWPPYSFADVELGVRADA